MTWAAVAIGGAALIGGVVSANAAQSAAGTQAGAANQATQTQLGMFNQTQANLAPFLQSGTTALSALDFGLGLPGPSAPSAPMPQQSQFMMPGGPGVTGVPSPGLTGVPGYQTPYMFGMGSQAQVPNTQAYKAALAQWQAQQGQRGQVPTGPGAGSLLKPFTLADFQQSPGYQFNLQQGQLAIDKAASARGNYYAPQTLQDTAKFSQGLASNEFMNAYNMYNQNQANVYNRLSGTTGAGQNAAASLGGFSGQVGGQIGQNITGAGNALAAGQIGQANAITGAIGGGYNAWLMNQILGQQQQGLNTNYGFSNTTGLSTNY